MIAKTQRIHGDHRGKLIALQEQLDIPFKIKRVFYIFDVKKNVTRGSHAHYLTKQYLIAVKGSCEIITNSGYEQKTYFLDTPDIGVFQDSMVWGEMKNFSSDCILLVLASEYFDENDYIHNFNEFQRLVLS